MRQHVVLAGMITLAVSSVSAALQAPETMAAWESYVRFTEARIDSEIADPDGDAFLVMDYFEPSERDRCQRHVRSGDVCIVKLSTVDDEGKSIPVPDGMIHHWYGAVLVPEASVEEVIAFVQRYEDSARIYPEVEESRLLEHEGDVFEIFLRLKRTKVLTVHYNTNHDVTYRDHGDTRATSRSLATRIREIDHPGESDESEKSPGDDRGFLWGLNSYWRFQETPDGTVVECESVSLSRSVPVAVQWLVRTYIDSVPRESLESTLSPIRENLAP